MLGERLKELREDYKMTQEELARLIGVSRSAVSAYEIEASEPSIKSLVKVADLFNVSLDYLAGRTKEKTNLNLLDKQHKELLMDIAKEFQKYNINKK